MLVTPKSSSHHEKSGAVLVEAVPVEAVLVEAVLVPGENQSG